jgi:hypothetical protein
MKATRSSEMFINIYQITRRHIPDDSDFLIYLIMVYLKTVVSRIVGIMNKELEKMWEEVAVANFV